MPNTITLFSMTLFACASVAGCGSSTTTADATDAGTHDDGAAPDVWQPPPRTDAAAPDADDASDASDASDARPAPLVPGGAHVYGITDDGYLVFAASSAPGSAIDAIALTGGQPITLGSVKDTPNVEVIRSAVILFGPGTSVPLHVWTRASGVKLLSSGADDARPPAVSPDSAKIAYLETNVDGTTCGVVVMNADATGKTVLVPAVACRFSELTFAATGDLVVNGFTSATDGGPLGSTVSQFAAGSWTRKDLATDARYAVDPTGKWVLLTTSSSSVVSLSGSDVIPIAGKVTAGVFDSTGTAFVYADDAGAIVRLDLATKTPTTLVPSGCGGVTALSPDDKTVLCYGSSLIASALTPGPATSFASSPGFYGGFTADSRFVISYYEYTLYTSPVTGAPFSVLFEETQYGAHVRGSGIVVVDRTDATAKLLDAANPAAVRTLATEVDLTGGVAVSAAKDELAYVAKGASPGIYLVAVP